MTQQKYLALGGATGIGQQVCEKLMSSGHEVILMDRVAPEFEVTHYIQIDLGVIVNLASKAGQFWQQSMPQVQSLLALHDWKEIDGWCAGQEIEHVRAYNLSKEALIVWSKLLAARLIERQIRVVSVSPAAVSTGILDDFMKAFGDKVAQNLKKVGRPGNADEICKHIIVGSFIRGENK